MKFIKYTIYIALIVFGLSIGQSSFAAVSFGNVSIQSYTNGKQVLYAPVNVSIDKGQTQQYMAISSVYLQGTTKSRTNSVFKIKTSDIKTNYAKVIETATATIADNRWGSLSGGETISAGDEETKGLYAAAVFVDNLALTPGYEYNLFFQEEKTAEKSRKNFTISMGYDKKAYVGGLASLPKEGQKPVSNVLVTQEDGSPGKSPDEQPGISPDEEPGISPDKDLKSSIGGGIKLKNPLKPGLDTIPKIINAILDGIVIPIAVPIFILAIIWTGILFVIARGKSEAIADAKKSLKWTLIGGAIILGSKLIATAMTGTLGAITGTVIK